MSAKITGKGFDEMRNIAGALFVLILLSVPTNLMAQQIAADTAPALPPTAELLATLSAEERAELLSRLTDEQVRILLSEYLKAGAEPAADLSSSAIEQLEERGALFRTNFVAVLNAAPQLPQVPLFAYQQLSEGRDAWYPLRVLAYLFVILAIAYGSEWLAMRLLSTVKTPLKADPGADFLGRFGRAAGMLLIDLLGLAIFTAITVILFFIAYEGQHEPTRLFVLTLITAIVLFRVITAVSRMLFAPRNRVPRVVPLDDADSRIAHRYVTAVAAIGSFGVLGCDLMRLLGLDKEPHQLLLLGVASLFALVLVTGIWRVRKGAAASMLVAGGHGESNSGILKVLAGLWYLPVMLYIAIIYVLGIFNGFTGKDSGSTPGLASLFLIAILPLADRILCGLVGRYFGPADDSPGSSQRVFRRAIHILVGVIAVIALAAIWRADLFSLDDAGIGGRMVRAAVDIALTVFVGYLAWGLLQAFLMRHMPVDPDEQSGGDEGGESNVTRLGTVLPLFMRMAQISIAVMVVMVVLSALGVNIGPLLAGAGVVGIAVGFGAQTLVRDLVSGLFFLIDDAFRRGEYVDIGSVKGTVEGINMRSLVLRHHLGPLHTVPYGEIQYLTNYSRDWMIMKLEFRVGYDTDVDKVKKIFKQIGREMLEHPEMGRDFIEPFKSQGVKAMEDSAMIVRGKFMAKPGKQFSIRKEIYSRVQKAFQEAGIQFAHRRVTVELPPDAEFSAEKKKEIAEAAGAAAMADDEKKQGRN